MSGLKTKESKRSVTQFINDIEDKQKREDCKVLLKLFKETTKKPAKLWEGNNLIGFGKYTYKRKGGKEEFEWFNSGFAPRKSNITLYLSCNLDEKKEELEKLGKVKAGKGCIYVKKLEDINIKVLEKMIKKYKDLTLY
jgi:hypothetical protein